MYRILLVDDDEKIRKLVSRILQPATAEIVQAGDDQEGLTIWTWNGPFDLVVTDLNMPRQNGYEMARRLGKNVPIIFITSESFGLRDKVDGMKAASDGRIVVLDKPFKASVLLEQANNLLQRKH
ncbi:MAG: response regulator [Candidatus Magasanikbacteria bacterium]